MASLWGDMSFRDVVGAAGMVGANLQAFEDRERKKRLDAAAEKRADKRLKMEEENHEIQKDAKERTQKLIKMQDAYGKAMAAKKAGRTGEFMQHIQTIQGLRTDGIDPMQIKDMRNFSPEEQEDFFARNPNMEDLRGNDFVAQVFNRTNDRIEHIGFNNADSILDYYKGIVNPQQLIKDDATMQATMEQKRRDAMPVVAIDDDNKAHYYIDLPYKDKEGQFRMRRTELNANDAMKYDASIVELGKVMQRKQAMSRGAAEVEAEAGRLGLKETRARTAKLEAQARQAEGGKEAPYTPDKATQQEAYNQLVDRFIPRGRADMMSETDVATAQKKIDAVRPFLGKALAATGGDIGAAVTEAEDLYQYDLYKKEQKRLQREEAARKKAASEKKTKKKAASKRAKEVLSEREKLREERRKRSERAAASR